MKKMIMMFFVLIAMPVFAENRYTEYELIGTQDTEPIVDELTKYEPVVLHRFYTLKEGPRKIITDDTYRDYDVWMTHSIKKIVTKEPVGSTAEEAHFISRAMENLEISSISAKNIDINNVDIEKIVFSSEGKTFYTAYPPNDARFTIPIELHKINDLEIEFYYDCKVDSLKFTINLNSENGNTEAAIVPLSKKYHKMSITLKTMDAYNEFLNANNIDYKFSMQYYTHKEVSYECFNYVREYLTKPMEEDAIDGYTYDKEEDTTVYKVYKRQIIEEHKPESNDQLIEEPPKQEINTEPVYAIPAPKKAPSIPVDKSKVLHNTTSKPQEELSTSEQDDKTTDETLAYVTTEKDETEKSEQIIECNCEEMKEAIELLRSIKWLLTIIIILIIIKLIHTFSVNIVQ